MGRVEKPAVRLMTRAAVWMSAVILGLMACITGIVSVIWSFDHHKDEVAQQRGMNWIHSVVDTNDLNEDQCNEYIRVLNITAAAGVYDAYAIMARLDVLGVCGDWPDVGDINELEQTLQHRRFLTVDERFNEAHRRFMREIVGSEGSRRFWQRYYSSAYPCRRIYLWQVDGELIDQAHRDPGFSVRDAHRYWFERNHDCGRRLVEHANRALSYEHGVIRSTGAGMMHDARWRNNSNSIWWKEFVLPGINDSFWGGHYLHLLEDAPINLECQSDSERRQQFRELAGLGHDEATTHWLEMGVPRPDDGEVFCPDSSWFDKPVAWRGGYDTPFWYAVHAIRTGDDMAQAHMPAIEADIGSDCMAMARILAGHLENVLPGPPQDIPAARQMIAESITCQPEGMREPALYPDGFYEPVETLAFPTFEPRFVPTPVSETISVPD